MSEIIVTKTLIRVISEVSEDIVIINYQYIAWHVITLPVMKQNTLCWNGGFLLQFASTLWVYIYEPWYVYHRPSTPSWGILRFMLFKKIHTYITISTHHDDKTFHKPNVMQERKPSPGNSC